MIEDFEATESTNGDYWLILKIFSNSLTKPWAVLHMIKGNLENSTFSNMNL